VPSSDAAPTDRQNDTPESGHRDREPNLGSKLDRRTLTRRARFGVLVLAGRAVVLQLTQLVGTIYLARVLDAGDFGIYAIVQFALSCFTLLGDAGLAASLIQKQTEPTQRELSTVWWVQVLIGLAVIGAVWLLAPLVLSLWPDTASSTVWLLRVLSFQFLFTSLRVIPALLLERELRFTRLSILDFIATMAFYGTAVTLAHRGFGAGALVSAVLVQGLTGLVLIFVLRPWFPSFVFDATGLRPMLKFGLAFQGKVLTSFVNGAITPLYAGAVLGKQALGLNNFARDAAYLPLKLVEILSRVTFPLYSRLQGDDQAFAASLGRSVQLCAMTTFFFSGLLFGLGPNLISVVYSDKWLPAMPALYVYSAAIGIGFLSPLIASALDALGKPQVIFRLSVAWTLLNWAVVSVSMIFWKSVLAFAIAYCVHVVFGNLAVIMMLRKLLPNARIWPHIRVALLSAVVVATLGRLFLGPWAWDVARLILAVLGCVAVYLGLIALLDRQALVAAIALLRRRRST